MKLFYIFILLLGMVSAEHEGLNQVSIQVGTDGDKGWTFSGFSGVDPELTLQRGIAYKFLMNAPPYQLILQEHDKPHITIAQSAGSGTGHFVVVFDNSIQGKVRYKAANAIWMHGDITLTGTYDKPTPHVDNLYPTPAPPASPLPSPSPVTEPICCDAVIASCEACKAKMSIDQYCHYFPSTQGCSANPTYCCKALIASCLACQLNMELDNYCAVNPNVQGCEFGAGNNNVVDDSVGSRIVLDIDFSDIGAQGSHIRTIWEAMLINEFATVMGISKDRITIDNLSPGSVIVDFSIHDGPSGELTPEQSIELLNSMILNTGSGLWTSNYLNILPAANRIKSWPLPQVNGAPMDPPPIIPNTVPHAHPNDHHHDAAHNDDNADHHHHPSDGSVDPNDHHHKKEEESSDDTDWGLIAALAGGGLVVVILIIFITRNRGRKTIIHQPRQSRDFSAAPYTLYGD